jgi:hypothetical protein
MANMDRRGWHLSKGFDVGHVMATLALLGGMVYGYGDFRERIAKLEGNQARITDKLTELLANQQRIDADQNASIKEIRIETRDAYLRIDGKLDTLREKMGR